MNVDIDPADCETINVELPIPPPHATGSPPRRSRLVFDWARIFRNRRLELTFVTLVGVGVAATVFVFVVKIVDSLPLR